MNTSQASLIVEIENIVEAAYQLNIILRQPLKGGN